MSHVLTPALAGLHRNVSPHGSLVALSTMKDEGPYVIEWVAHHLALGFTELMVYTNDCSDGTDLILRRMEQLGIGVHHRDNVIPEGMKPHPSMLKSAAEEALIVNSDWLLVLDADEFFCINHPSGTMDGLVADLMAMDAHAMVVTWRIFGSSRIRDWSRDPVTTQFTWAAPPFWNKGWGTKTLLRFDPKYLRLGMHRPIIKSQHKETDYPDSVLWVNGSGRPLEEWFKFRGWRSIRRTLGYDWAQMNHYAIKSMDAFSLRKYRGNANLKKDKYNADYWSLQDRNEVQDLSIQRHVPRMLEIRAALLSDPELARLHDAANSRAEARLAEYRAQPEYQDYVAKLVEASSVPITQVVAKPPKARDPAQVAAVQTRIEQRRNALSKTERRTAAPAGWGAPAASPYVAGPIDRRNEIALEQVDNQGITLPVDPRVFTALTLDAIQSGKFERRHARNIGFYLDGAHRVADIGSGIGFVGMKAHLLRPEITVLNHDERQELSDLGRQLCTAQFPASADRVSFSSQPLRRDDLAEGGAGPGPATDGPPADQSHAESPAYDGLAALVAGFRPDALRLSPAAIDPEALSPGCLSGVTRVILPFFDPAEMADIRASWGPVLEPAGFTERPEASENGSLLYLRGAAGAGRGDRPDEPSGAG